MNNEEESPASKSVEAIRAFIKRVTHWQEGRPDKHDAIQELAILDDQIEWLENGICEWREEALAQAKRPRAPTFFGDIGKRIAAQDNRMTSHPIFVVLEGPQNPAYGRFVTACFTMEGAQAVIDADRHNLDRPYVYIKSGHMNMEFRCIRDALIAVGKAES